MRVLNVEYKPVPFGVKGRAWGANKMSRKCLHCTVVYSWLVAEYSAVSVAHSNLPA